MVGGGGTEGTGWPVLTTPSGSPPTLPRAGKGVGQLVLLHPPPQPLGEQAGWRVARAKRWGAVAATEETPGGDCLVSIREPWSAFQARRQSWGWLW